MLDNYEFDMDIILHNESSLVFPINQNGAFVRDINYDKQIQKFIARDFMIDKNYKMEIYDDQAFKRSDLKSKMVWIYSNILEKVNYEFYQVQLQE